MLAQLIQPYYRSGNEARDLELEQVEAINKHVFGKSAMVLVGGDRPTYAYLFSLCDPDRVNIIANSDIYFSTKSATQIVEFYKDPANHRTCMALSRWEVQDHAQRESATLWDHRDSQDAWVFWGKPDVPCADFTLGIPGCDNRIAKVILDAGYTVINPSRTIKSYHLHVSGHRTYGTGRGGTKRDKIPPPYHYITPHEL
jgi:hypothetical protein